jgi:hypothetical protein
MQERSYNADNCIDNPKSVFAVLTVKEKDYLKQNYTCAFYKKSEIIFKEGDASFIDFIDSMLIHVISFFDICINAISLSELYPSIAGPIILLLVSFCAN